MNLNLCLINNNNNNNNNNKENKINKETWKCFYTNSPVDLVRIGFWDGTFFPIVPFFLLFIFFYLGFLPWKVCTYVHFHAHITRQQGKGEAISLTPLSHFHPVYRHLNISREITVEGSPLHIAHSQTWTGNLWFLSASRKPLSYAP